MDLETLSTLVGWLIVPCQILGIVHSVTGRGPHWWIHGLLVTGVYLLFDAGVDSMADNHTSAGISTFFGVLFIWLWWMNDGNDRWKKTKKKLAEKVAEIGGKLQVVPNPA